MWIRHCAQCGTSQHRVDTPDQEDTRPALKWDTPNEAHEDFLPTIRRRMAKFDRGTVAAAVRGNVLDWRAKQAGGD
jgi:hypothetical protein